MGGNAIVLEAQCDSFNLSYQPVINKMRSKGKHVTTPLRDALERLGFDPIPPPPLPPERELVDVSPEAGLNVYKTLTNISQVSNTLLNRALAEQDTKLTLLVMDRIENQLTLAAKLQGLFTDGPMHRSRSSS